MRGRSLHDDLHLNPPITTLYVLCNQPIDNYVSDLAAVHTNKTMVHSFSKPAASLLDIVFGEIMTGEEPRNSHLDISASSGYCT